MRFIREKSKRIFHLKLFIVGCITLSACLPTPPPESTPTLEPTKDFGQIVIKVYHSEDGTRIDENRKIDKFIARVEETNAVGENDNGVIKLRNCENGQHITVWASGYYIKTENCITGQTEYNIPLVPITFSNNTNLAWISAGSGNEPQLNCIFCHNGQYSQDENEFQQWRLDGHSTVFYDQFFSTMYMGDDNYNYNNRNPITNTTWMLGEQGHQIRKLQYPSIPYWGTGFKLDYPTENGNCVYCHAPTSAVGSQVRLELSSTINEARNGQTNIYTEGINCDICHKVVNVQLDGNGYPHSDKPGILSFEFIHADRNLFIGPLTNAMDKNMLQNFSCAPVFSESSFCAPCHSGKFFDVSIYDSYGEWKRSKYGDASKDTYRTCQSCHMLPEGMTDISQAPHPNERKACSTTNKSNFDFNHNMMLRGYNDIESLIEQAGEVIANAEVKEGKIELTVVAANKHAGHDFPTDSPLRHLILVIEAKTSTETELPMIDGDRIPSWGGFGISNIDYAGKPGQIYANILMANDTFFSPAVDYWNAVDQAWKESDTRIEAGESRQSKYIFALPPNGKATFTIRLIYRYAFIELARQKGWPVTDIIVDKEIVTVPK